MRKKERFVLGKRTFRSQKSKHFVLRIIHLAKLIIFMKDQEILRYSKMIIVARIFYDYFNVVVSKASIGENSVTERNLREIEKKGIEGLSKEEISNFKLICAHFSK